MKLLHSSYLRTYQMSTPLWFSCKPVMPAQNGCVRTQHLDWPKLPPDVAQIICGYFVHPQSTCKFHDYSYRRRVCRPICTNRYCPHGCILTATATKTVDAQRTSPTSTSHNFFDMFASIYSCTSRVFLILL